MTMKCSHDPNGCDECTDATEAVIEACLDAWHDEVAAPEGDYPVVCDDCWNDVKAILKG